MAEAAELEELRLQSPLIHELRQEVLISLCEILDVGDLWTEIAPIMPGIKSIDVDGCRKHSDQGQGSPSAFLLRIWASKGFCIVDLYNLFAMSRLVRCMQLMRNEVDSRFHFLEEYCTANTPRSADVHIRPQSSILATAGTSHTPSSARGHAPIQTPTSKVGGGSTILSSTNPSAIQGNVTKDDVSMFAGMKNTPSVTYAELMEATDDFDATHIIGKGGYGVVYRGMWKQLEVAVKRLSVNSRRSNGDAQREEAERLKQSLQELNILAMFRHDNILPVYGYSLDGPEPCLVYQFMANGSLDDRLQCRKAAPPLSWKQKARIAKGSAMGLLFLHEISRVPLIHGDVKTANILLDKHLEPKLGDFGLSREGASEADIDEKTVLIASHIKGTLAYLPPEFVQSKILTIKLDVYAFGVVLLEMASGLRAYLDSRRPTSLVDFAVDLEKKTRSQMGGGEETKEVKIKKKIWDEAKDKRTPGDEIDVFWTLWSTGMKCAHQDRFKRPKFTDIVDDLKMDYWGSD
ncbi:hypothetical protein PENTCL1PPCAC_18325 [Pristionchus entomophagus]|uniref:non-specific serine/threonine protein kinase n=1 Tax=Pristionchus entomophagus TaxID=358040 RepID=A0AAV5TPH5_9BILA|nr:hypothetical protein PENTCL1PPCAC_18325 [Pristionchus entomophagus]